MRASANSKVRTNIYLDERIHAEFKRVCRREGAKMSGKFEDFAKHYVQAHSSGNPQLSIAAYVKPEEPQPMRVLCLFIDGAMSGGRVHCRRAGMWIPGINCYSCEKTCLGNKNES
jgi:hypothetical protein